MAHNDKHELLGIPIGLEGLAKITNDALDAVCGTRPPVVFACANPHSLVAADNDEVFRRSLLDADQVVADGVGVVIMSRVAGARIGPRITGTDYYMCVMSKLEQRGEGRVFYFGSSKKVLDLIAERMTKEFPSLTLCGTLSPPFHEWSDEENMLFVDEINNARPDVLWVGMTAPKQEKWVFRNRGLLNAPVIGSIGAVFDFYAGTYSRAPQWMRKLGIEFVYRLVKEPKRMWRRNFISSPWFVWLVLWRHVLGVGRHAQFRSQ